MHSSMTPESLVHSSMARCRMGTSQPASRATVSERRLDENAAQRELAVLEVACESVVRSDKVDLTREGREQRGRTVVAEPGRVAVLPGHRGASVSRCPRRGVRGREGQSATHSEDERRLGVLGERPQVLHRVNVVHDLDCGLSRVSRSATVENDEGRTHRRA